MSVNKIAIIGLGLIGGSFAKACKKFNLVNEIYAFNRSQESIIMAKDAGIIVDSISLDADFSDFDLVVLACPLASYKEILQRINISDNTTLIDLGSVKNNILPQKENFIGCHPIAGSDKTGFANSDADLFADKKFLICNEGANLEKLELVKNIATEIGSNVEFIDSKKHDEIYALVSHLPQFLSFVTAEFCPTELEDEFFKNAFRLNNSSPKIWEEIFELNAQNIEELYSEFFNNLADLVEHLEEDEFDKLLDFKTTGQTKFSQVLLEEDFAEIFFRLMVVISYLKLNKISDYQSYCGTGFKDFTSITNILNLSQEQLIKLIKINYDNILDILESFLT